MLGRGIKKVFVLNITYKHLLLPNFVVLTMTDVVFDAGREFYQRGDERAGQPVHTQLREDRRREDGVQSSNHLQV